MSTENSSRRCPRCGGPAYLDVVHLKCDACRSVVGVALPHLNDLADDEPRSKTVKTSESRASHYS